MFTNYLYRSRLFIVTKHIIQQSSTLRLYINRFAMAGHHKRILHACSLQKRNSLLLIVHPKGVARTCNDASQLYPRC